MALCVSKQAVAVRPAARRVAVARPAARLVVRASAEPKVNRKALAAGLTVAAASALTHPLIAEAAVTPSLKNFLGSLVAGGVVLAGIAVAITGVSQFDTTRRG
ncbi:hypothetical protein HYH03_007737 [Edaphochlamys debaryana]|uniref:Uncharacterized protein n=1 Tax=Edaphochlamys debaryana TaxID=47281 RepID=A0A836C046_9CHLO|nr:hypothetical protein HYH03_007737 [Edaphochlamys debaryana]|eukprot:KAG2494098.1 hypothetical protein HYH03_007737 [Edaphochlamys debaryana]